MGVNQPVLDIAFLSKDTASDGGLQELLGDFANPLVSATPRIALDEWKGASCNHALIVIDGYSLGREALALCRRIRLAGVTKPIVLAWPRGTNLDLAVCREFGASEIISRPFDANGVAASIRAAAAASPAVGSTYGMARPWAVRPQPSTATVPVVGANLRIRAESIPVT